MILTAHQPVYLPWLGLFHRIALADTFVYFDAVQYQTHDFNSRNKIKTPQGELWLTLPVQRKGYHGKKLCEIELDNTQPWAKKHWRSIEQNYSKAPYFDLYAPFFEETYKRTWTYLAELNEYMLLWFLETLGITRKFLRASQLQFEGKKSDLVLDMCRKVGADTFIFGSLGAHYAQQKEFERAGISLLFQNYVHPVYPQLHGAFIPHLSIIDLLFNCGPQSLQILMQSNVQNITDALRASQNNELQGGAQDRKITLRAVLKEDCRLIWDWANDPATRTVSFSPEPIPWDEHTAWFHEKLSDERCRMYMGLDGRGFPVGQIRFDCSNGEAQVDVHIDPAKRGQGFGTRLILAGTAKLFEETTVHTVHAFIRKENAASIRSFTKAGFSPQGSQMLRNAETMHYILKK